jgi:hypothetical protein
LGDLEFSAHCRAFANSKGSALVEVGRGVLSALIKYLNTIHGLQLESLFTKLAAAGLMPERFQPRVRVRQAVDLPAWKLAVDELGEKQRVASVSSPAAGDVKHGTG